jgi:type IV secretion system protein VirB10
MVKQKASPPEGLPEITEPSRKKSVLLILLLSLFLLLGIHFLFHFKKTETKAKFAVEESYTLPNNETERPNAPPLKRQSEIKQLSEQQLALLQAKQKELQQRLSAPIMLLDQQGNQFSHSTTPVKSPEKTLSSDPNSQFLQQLSGSNTHKRIQANSLGPLNQLIAQGQIMHAILETAINSDLPGSLRAIIDQPIYAEDGSQVLISPGSRLIGQYKSGMLQGQSRIFIVWTRLITPAGLSLNLDLPGVDSLGMAGTAADVIERHFWQRFGTATLFSILGAGTSNVGVANNASYNATQAYRLAIANSLNQTAQQTLQQQTMISPTLWVNQGSPIQVFVVHDLDFRSVRQETKDKVNVF